MDIWGDNIFDSKGFGGIELFNAEISENTIPALDKWTQYLNQGKKVLGTANSDAHHYITSIGDSFGTGTTYLYMPGWDGKDHQVVYDAMKNGRAVASEKGSLVTFTASTPSNGLANIGDTVYLNSTSSEEINLQVQALGADDRQLNKIILYSNYAAAASYPASKTSITIKKKGKTDYPYPPSTGKSYFRLVAQFRLSGKSVEKVYTNPIWLKSKTGIDFEDLNHRSSIGTHYPGLTFANEWRVYDMTAPGMNYDGYPPHSGTKVASPDIWGTSNSGTIWLDSPVTFIEGWFSAAEGVSMEAYDYAGNLIKSRSIGTSYGYSTRIRLDVPESTPIYTVIIHDTNNRWAMDDLAYSR